jgi:cellulose synthase/poly-beta-1,6-N-acetylglucosamine synthase-like glycosyltransferase
MEILLLVSSVIQIFLILYLGLSAFYIVILSIAGLFKIKRKKIVGGRRRRFAVMIPGYKEDAVIVDVAMDATKQHYPAELFDVVIIADSFQPETIEKLKKLPIKLIEVSFDKSTKSKALNKAMEQLPANYYDVAMILDADNLMEPDLLQKTNQSFDEGFRVAQGHRVAKNLNTSLALLDAISEEINNHLFRKGHRVLGLSSALIGSGMAFDYEFFKNQMKEVKAIGGFDKDLELRLTKNGDKIDYLDNALIYDEKVSETKSFSNQRRRWLSAQFVYFTQSFIPATKDLIAKGNLDYFLKSFQMIQPPRIILLGVSWMLAIISLFLLYDRFTPIWVAIFILVNFSMLISIPGKFWNKQFLIALMALPKGFWLMFQTLFKLKGANKTFIHTAHGQDKTK